MRRSIKFRLTASICAAVLFVSAFSYISVPTQAEGAAERARKAAEGLVALAVGAAEKCREAEEAAIEAEAAAAAAKAKVEEVKAAGDEAVKNAENSMERLGAERSRHRNVSRAEDRAKEASRKAAKLREAARKPCDVAEAARAVADEALRKAEDLLGEKIGESGSKDRPPKNLVEEKKKLDKLRKDLNPQQGAVVPLSAPETAQTKTANGLHTVNFDTLHGRVIVHLPDDMAAGDTISGTVVEEPKGSTPAEKEKNLEMLQGLVIEIGGSVIPSKQPRFTIQPRLEMVPNELDAGQSQTILITIRNGNQGYNRSNELLGRAVIPSNPRITSGPQNQSQQTGMTSSGTVIAPDPKVNPNFQIPTLGQQGRLVEITGPFDGNSSNTTLRFGPALSTAQDFEKNAENVTGGFGLITPLAESRNKMIFESSTNFTGAVQMMLKEGDAQMLAPYRNVGVRLSAPKTNLLKGEATTLTVKVEGLEGIKEDVPLHLENASPTVVRMAGGDNHTFAIKPSSVQADGTFTTTRAITGQKAGAFTVTATVVVFDLCLEDDNKRNSLVFSSGTGDFILCDAAGGRLYVYADRPILEDGSPTVNPPIPTVRPGIYKQGAITVADFHYAGGHFGLQLDGHAATATLQTTNPKRTFTITDRDIRNNTCSCK